MMGWGSGVRRVAGRGGGCLSPGLVNAWKSKNLYIAYIVFKKYPNPIFAIDFPA